MLSRNRMNEIEAKAQDVLLTAFEDESAFNLPIKISKIAEMLKLTLKEGEFKDPDVVGAYDKASKTIYVAEHDPYVRKAFTIAHEMGHFILHTDKERETFFRKDIVLSDKEERTVEQEANYFAANLLMPRGTLTRYYKLVSDARHLADIFGVSHSAMLLRLKNLGMAD